MAFRKRRNTPAGSPLRPSSHHHHAIVLDCHHRSHSSLKYVLFVTAVALLLLIFVVSQRREEAASCRLCLRGDGTVREYRDGDGGLRHFVLADEDEDESGDEMVEGMRSEHPHVCPRLYHEKQIRGLDLMHAFNNLMQKGNNPQLQIVVPMSVACASYEAVATELKKLNPLELWNQKQQRSPSSGKGRISKEERDELAERHVSMDNHHPRENYDAVVLQAAAASRGKIVYFFHTVEDVEREIDFLEGHGDHLLGFLLHLKRRLWIAVRPHRGLWYFDSTEAAPLLFCDGAHTVSMFLHKVFDDGGLVVGVLKPRPVNPIMLAEQPPPSWTDIEDWKYWLFG